MIPSRTMLRLLLLLIILTSIITVVAPASPINVNLKSKSLSKALGRGGDGGDDDDDGAKHGTKRTSASDTEKETKSSGASIGGVSVDLSGRFDCCLLGGGGATTTTKTIAEDDGRVKSPSNPGGRTVVPLFQRRIRHRESTASTTAPATIDRRSLAPTVFVGAAYDFHKIWWGVTRVVTTLAWETKGEQQRPHPARSNTYGSGYGGRASATGGDPPTLLPGGAARLTRRLLGRGSGLGANLSLEKGILSPNDYSTELELVRQLSSHDGDNDGEDGDIWRGSRKPPSISVRLDTDRRRGTIGSDTGGGAGRSVTIAGRTSLHPRVDIVARSTAQLDSDGDRSFFSDRIPSEVEKGWKEGVWVPQISMTPGGRLVSKNAFGFRGIQSGSRSSSSSVIDGGGSGGASSSHRWYDGMQTGIRLVASRQLNWNALGLAASKESLLGEHFTFVRLELSGLDRSGRTFRCVTLEAAVERLRDSARVTLLQERVTNRNGDVVPTVVIPEKDARL